MLIILFFSTGGTTGPRMDRGQGDRRVSDVCTGFVLNLGVGARNDSQVQSLNKRKI